MISSKEIVSIIADSDIDVDTEKLDHNEDLTKQGLDSLDMSTILFALEERFSISVSDEDIEANKLSSIDKIVQYVNARTE
jgi:acyl carrier protein